MKQSQSQVKAELIKNLVKKNSAQIDKGWPCTGVCLFDISGQDEKVF